MIAISLNGNEQNLWAFLGRLKRIHTLTVVDVCHEYEVWRVFVIPNDKGNEKNIIEDIEQLMEKIDPKLISIGYTQLCTN